MTEEMSVEDALTLQLIEQTARADDCLRELEQETKRHDEAEDIQQKRIAELEGDLELERERVKQLTVIADGRAKLNTCYRLGTQRGAGAAVDRIRKAEGRLGQLDHDAAEGDTE